MITSLTRCISVCGHRHCGASFGSLVNLSSAPCASSTCLSGTNCPVLQPRVVNRGRVKASGRHQAQERYIQNTAGSQNKKAIIVEGYADKVAVQRAVSCAVSSCGLWEACWQSRLLISLFQGSAPHAKQWKKTTMVVHMSCKANLIRNTASMSLNVYKPQY